MKKILVVDDMQERHDAVIKLHPNDEVVSIKVCETACEMLALQGADSFDIIYLDHDAGGETYLNYLQGSTFYPVACLLTAAYTAYANSHDDRDYGKILNFPEVRIISANKPAAEKMFALMNNVGIYAKIFNLYE